MNSNKRTISSTSKTFTSQMLNGELSYRSFQVSQNSKKLWRGMPQNMANQ